MNMTINMTIDSICNSLQLNNLKINISKTKYIQLCNNKTNIWTLLVEDIPTLEEDTETRFLGLLLYRYCSWKTHNRQFVY